MCRHDSTNEMHSPQKQGGQVVTAGRKTDLLSHLSSFCARTPFKKKPLLANGGRYLLVGGTRQRYFVGINFKPRKTLENAQTPTSQVHALLGALPECQPACSISNRKPILTRFYLQPKYSQPSKKNTMSRQARQPPDKILTRQIHDEVKKTILPRNKTEPKSLNEIVQNLCYEK